MQLFDIVVNSRKLYSISRLFDRFEILIYCEKFCKKSLETTFYQIVTIKEKGFVSDCKCVGCKLLYHPAIPTNTDTDCIKNPLNDEFRGFSF